jgi:hypothetical protein
MGVVLWKQSRSSPTGEVFWTGTLTPLETEGVYKPLSPGVTVFLDEAFRLESEVVALGMCSILGRTAVEPTIWMVRRVGIDLRAENAA